MFIVREYFIICAGDGSESLLTSSVPNLEFNILTVNRECSKSEIDSNGCEIRFTKLIVCKSEQKGTLANTRISNDNQFEEIVIFLDHFCGIYIFILNINNQKSLIFKYPRWEDDDLIVSVLYERYDQYIF